MQKEINTFRIKIFIVALLFVFPCVILRLFILQVVNHYEYAEMATKNLDRFKDITPRRGALYDRNGILLAQTAPSYDIYFEVKPLIEQADSAKDTFLFNENNIARFHALFDQYHPKRLDISNMKLKIENAYKKAVQEVRKKLALEQELAQKRPLKYRRKKIEYEKDYFHRKHLLEKNVSSDLADKLLQDSSYLDCSKNPAEVVNLFPGFTLQYDITRRYPQEKVASHLLGYTGKIPENRIKYLVETYDYKESDEIGQYGIERLFESVLRGGRGYAAHSPQGFFVDSAIDGLDVELTIDASAQKLAEEELAKMIEKIKKKNPNDPYAQNIGGAAVFIEIETGEIIVMASAPGYDNNSRQRDYNALLKDPSKPLLNRAIVRSTDIPPGSVFKVCVALYALENGFLNSNDTYNCCGYLWEPSSFKCTHAHGKTNVIKAIEGSCNVFFYNVGEKMKHEHLIRCARQFGFDRKSGLGFLEESRPELPKPSTRGDDRLFGIGQLMQATPIQVARAMACVARRGDLPALKIIRRFRNIHELDSERVQKELLPSLQNISLLNPPSQENGKPVVLSEKNWELVLDGMRLVTVGSDGTALAIGKMLGNIKIASKTGTSQVGYTERDHAWFAGFAPFERPKYAFAVLVELAGYGGEAAGPIAAKIIKHLLEK